VKDRLYQIIGEKYQPPLGKKKRTRRANTSGQILPFIRRLAVVFSDVTPCILANISSSRLLQP
jgi:hypothetical protein